MAYIYIYIYIRYNVRKCGKNSIFAIKENFFEKTLDKWDQMWYYIKAVGKQRAGHWKEI